MSSVTREYPYGTDTNTLVLCLDEKQMRMFQELTQIKARYITPLQTVSGARYDKIIILPLKHKDYEWSDIYKRWYLESVLTRTHQNTILHDFNK